MTSTGLYESPVEPQAAEGFPLSPAQRLIWRRQKDRRQIRAVCVVDIAGEMVPATLARGLCAVVARHEILRMSFRSQQGSELPSQVPSEAATIDWQAVDLTRRDGEDRERCLQELLDDARHRAGDLDSGPVLRAGLASFDERSARLFLSAPALCADAYSLRRLVEELAALLDVPTGSEGGLEEPYEYLDYCDWRDEFLESDDEEYLRGREYWQRRGRSATYRPNLPFAIPVEGGRYARRETAPIVIELGASVATAVVRCADVLEMAEADIVRAVWWTLLWRYTGAADLVVDELFSGRTDDELRTTLGPVARFLPVAGQLAAGGSFESLAARLARARRETAIWQHAFDPSREDEGREAPICGFSFQGWPEIRSTAGATLRLWQACLRPPFGILLETIRGPAGLSLRLTFDEARFKASDVAALAAQLQHLLEQVVEAPSTPVEALALTTGEERRRLLETLSLSVGTDETPTGTEPPAGTVHRRFEALAAATPGAPAVEVDGRRLDYGELNARANRLARYLRGLGVGPDIPVALYLERSPELVVGLLATLKAGGCYVASTLR